MLKTVVLGVVLVLTVATGSVATPKPPKPHSVSELVSLLAGHREDTSFPYATPPVTKAHLEDFKKLVHIANAYGINVGIGEDMSDYGLWGLYVPKEHIILLNQDLTTDGAVEVLIHELSHMLTPLLKDPNDDIVAQSVAYIICQDLGINDNDFTPYYMFFLTKNFEQSQVLVMQNAKEIERVSQFILNALGK